LKTKDDTVETNFHPRLTALLFELNKAYITWDAELIITSGSEHSAKHSFTSLHYADPCCAVDLRSWAIGRIPEAEDQLEILTQIAIRFCANAGIPPNWVEVILESDHIHIEYQPKRRNT